MHQVVYFTFCHVDQILCLQGSSLWPFTYWTSGLVSLECTSPDSLN